MASVLIVLLLLTPWVYGDVPNEDMPSQKQKLLVVLVQGVRLDYIDHDAHAGFARLARQGVRAEYVLPVFPATPYPNSYSIATGLYSESHGVIADYMFDEEHQSVFLGLPHSRAAMPYWWDRAEPIWIAAERRGLRSAVYWWPGCGVAFNETRPAICIPYPHNNPDQRTSIDEDFRNKVNEVLEVFGTDELSLAMMHYGLVGHYGRLHGPGSRERRRALYEFDGHLTYILDKLDALNLTEEVTLMVVSDHGLADTGLESTTDIVLEKYAPYIKYMLNYGSFSMVQPGKDMLLPLHKSLTDAHIEGLQIYTKEELPDRYHIKHSHRLLPLFLMTMPKYYILPLHDSRRTKLERPKRYLGFHGYDPELPEMRTIFYAQGPGLKQDHVIKPIVNVDYYNFMCRALGLEPRPNNGTWSRVDDALVESDIGFPNFGSSMMENSATIPSQDMCPKVQRRVAVLIGMVATSLWSCST
ncbi:glycerophosphocholine cholinephosphodiesterase ENPP6-like [Ornithodoros turicata]|uniref:glycerophosphocholine cholinephosphodiesterase ENPP6-like n=1 Tax=Ornithodoros turicata TaxID=34597 RepID=UPI0031393AA1